MATAMLAAAAALSAASACFGQTPTIHRHANAAADSPTSAAVEVAAALPLVFISGQTPLPRRPEADRFSPAYWGDTYEQASSVLAKVDAALKRLGLGPEDVVKMNVYLVGDAQLQGRMDGAGFGRAYAERYGSAAQPQRPARTTVQVAGLGAPGMLVEIEVIAARRRAPEPSGAASR